MRVVAAAALVLSLIPLTVEAQGLPPTEGPLKSWGDATSSVGLYPNFSLLELAFENPSAGQVSGYGQASTILNLGADFNLGPLFGLNGTSLHFQDLYVPFLKNDTYGGEIGGIGAAPNVFIPWKNHLQRLTIEQKYKKVFVEIGKSNAGDYFAYPVCNSGITCLSTIQILQNQAGFNPPPYSNYSFRAGAQLTPYLRLQGGVWKVDNAFPFANGYKLHDPRPFGTMEVGDIQYLTKFTDVMYPLRAEGLVFHNSSPQTDPLTRKVRHDANGMFVSARKTIWRADDGREKNPFPQSVSAFVSAVGEFDGHTSYGVQDTVDFGLTLYGPLKSRPKDSVSIQGTVTTLTTDIQEFIQQQTLKQSGEPYTQGRSEKILAVNADIHLSRGVFLSPEVSYIDNATSFRAASYRRHPRDGFAVGVSLVILASDLLGFGPSGYR